MGKAVWLGAGAAVAVITGIGLRYGMIELSRPPVTGAVPARLGTAVPADDPAAPFTEVIRQAGAFADAVSRAGKALLSPESPPPVAGHGEIALAPVQPDTPKVGPQVGPVTSDPSRPAPAKAEGPKPDAAKAGPVKTDPPKAETPKTEPTKAPAAKPDPAKADGQKAESQKTDPQKSGPQKTDPGKPGSGIAEAVRPDSGKPEAGKPDSGKGGTPQAATGVPPAPPDVPPVSGGLDLAQMAERFKAPASRTPVSAPIPDAPPAPPPVATAFAPADQYPLTDWTLDYGEAGYLGRLTLNGEPLKDRRPGLAETLEVSGWAGDSLIGIRFSHVLAALCGRVVGMAPVQDPTPEIGRTIHSNLSAAGWTLRLPVELLPRCDKPVLSVLAVRDGKFAYPLRGEQPLTLPADTVKAPASVTVKPLRPGDLPFLDRQPLTLTAKATTVRRCGASDCAPVGSLPAGDYNVAVMDRQRGWALLVTSSVSGWIPEGLLRPPVRKPAPAKPEGKPEDAKAAGTAG